MSDQAHNQAELKKIELFFDNTIKRFKSTFKAAAKEVGKRLVDNTPTYFEHEPTSGNTKANWNISVGAPDLSVDPNITDYVGDATKSEIRQFLQSLKMDTDTTVFISNGSDASKALEYGLYPKNPVKGSWHTIEKRYYIRSQNGYSLQAPQGIARPVEAQWPEIVRDAIRESATIYES